MKRAFVFFLLSVIITFNCFSQSTKDVIIEFTNVVPRGGPVYLTIFSNAEEFRKEEPKYMYDLGDSGAVVSRVVTLPLGDYVISGFQDANNNKDMDYNLLGIPRESVAISNYNGRGIPTKNFDRQKVTVTAATDKISVGLFKF
ncbi:MAG: DUF2141 domain-containing protein [Treponema sp.]|nr:DUF2141 domain-containing protein [Treponema sp.]